MGVAVRGNSVSRFVLIDGALVEVLVRNGKHFLEERIFEGLDAPLWEFLDLVLLID